MQLFKHQEEGIKYLKREKKAILADEMGLGKTRQAIIAAHGNEGMKLIVCPASLKINWAREIAECFPEEKKHISIISPKDEGVHMERWTIINYDILERYMPNIIALVAVDAIGTLILDEAHYIKGKSIRASCIIGGGKDRLPNLSAKIPNVYLLTGTPILNRPIDLFNLLKAIKHPLGSNRQEYAKRYCNAFWMVRVQNVETGKTFMCELKKALTYYRPPQYKQLFRFLDESGESNVDELKRKIKRSMLRRKKEDCLDLPEKIIRSMPVELDPAWRKAYDRAWDDYIAFVESNIEDEEKIENIKEARHLVELNKLKQVCSQAKVERIIADTIEAVEEGQQVIIFSQFTETVRRIMEGLEEAKIDAEQLIGDSTTEERQNAVDAFQAGKAKAIVMNLKAGGVGITLTKANIVKFADMEWSPAIHGQAEDRAHRIGQKGTVIVEYYVAEETIEEDTLALLDERRGLIKQILEGKAPKESENMLHAFLRKIGRKVSTDQV